MRSLLCGFLFVATWHGHLGHAHGQDGRATTGRYALLVGVSTYPNLAENLHLKGPANDVLLMRTLLTTHFGFAAENIVILAEHAGKDRLPTRANIEKEFRLLAQKAKQGDQVVIFMAGHGSQQPESDNPDDPEPDGLDEIFLPRDVGAWDGGTGKVVNAIVDDELGRWLKDIQAKRAFVWIVFDSCHSGTMMRGASETARQIDATNALKIPADALRAARVKASKRGGGEATRGGPVNERSYLAKDAGVVAIYACQSAEVTVEQELPRNSADAKPYGLLTYTMNELITRSAQAGKALTYRELVQRVHSHYAQLGRSAPTPQIEGKNEDRDREVLGQAAWSGRSRILLRAGDDAWKINAGSMHGLTEGSILAVFPPSGDKAVGHVRVTQLKTFEAEVEPCAFQDVPLNKNVPDDSRCELAQMDYGDSKLRIAVDPKDSSGKPVPGNSLQPLLQKLTGEGSLLQIAPDFRKADWLIRQDAGKVFLVPGSEWSSAKAPMFGPYKADDFAQVKDAFTRIARAQTLKKLAAGADEVARGGSAKVKLDMELLRLKNTNDKKGTAVAFDTDSLAFHDGEVVTLKLTNNSRFAVDVTVLYINSNHGIDVWFPDEEINRLQAGESIHLPPVQVTAKTVGLENVVVVAVKATTKLPMDFTCLAQPTLERVRGTAKSAEAMKTPLGDFLLTGMYGQGNTRSIRRTAVEEYQMKMLPWRVLPGKRPAEAK